DPRAVRVGHAGLPPPDRDRQGAPQRAAGGSRRPRARQERARALPQGGRLMIFDAHMHVGDFGPMMNVGVDTDGIAELMREHDIDGGMLFAPDASLVQQCMDAIPGLYGLVWASPKAPGYVEETARLLDTPRFRGIKLH